MATAWAAKRISGASTTPEGPASVKDWSSPDDEGSVQRNFAAADGSRTNPGAVHSEKCSSALEGEWDPAACRGRRLVVERGADRTSAGVWELQSELRRALPRAGRQPPSPPSPRRPGEDPSGSSANGWGRG